MKPFLSLILAAALALSLTACGTGSPSGTSSSPSSSTSSEQVPMDVPFSLAVYSSYSLHPVLAENRANLMLSSLLYEPLFQLNDRFEPVPVLCSTYSASDDFMTWTFRLQSGITFSDGTPLTGTLAADALNLARQPGSRYAQRLRNVTAITGDESSVTLSLNRPNGSLPALLDIPLALGSGEHPAGTGPYLLSDQGDNPSLVVRTDWWQKKELPFSQIPLVSVDKSDDLISSFASGATGLVEVDLMGTNALGYSGNYQTWDYATTDLLYLGFNTQKGLCQNPAFRQAVAKSIDRSSIVQIDYARHAAAAALPIHPNSALSNVSLEQALKYAPEEAVSLFESLRAGGRSLVLIVNSENNAKVAAAQRIAYQLESDGLEIVLSKLSFEDYTAALSAGTFDLYLGEVVLTGDFDLSPLLSSSGSLNYGRWQNSQTDLLLSDFLKSGEESTRKTTASALLAHLSEQVPIAPICFKHGSVLTQWGRLSGLEPIRGNVFYNLDKWVLE